MNILRLFYWTAFPIVLVVLGFALPRPVSGQTYRVEDLGALEGTESRALGINAYGQVVGSVKLADGTSRAFRYTDEDGMVSLGTFNTTGGVRPSATGAGINNSGLVVGASLKAYVSRTNHDCAAAWPDIAIQDVSYNCASSFFSPPSWARGVNDAGQIVGQYAPAPQECQGFLRQPDGGTVLFDNLCVIPAINASGKMIGVSNGSEPARSFIFTDATDMQDLGTLGGLSARAFGMNEIGQVVGDSTAADNSSHAFRWTEGEIEDLGTLPNTRGSLAQSINNYGVVVGSVSHSEGDHAFIYTDDAGLQDLNDLIAEPNWILVTAAGINDAGQIVGYGLHSGTVRAFRLTPEN